MDGGRGRGQDSQGASPAPRGARDRLVNSTILPTPRLGNLGVPPSSLQKSTRVCWGVWAAPILLCQRPERLQPQQDRAEANGDGRQL